MPSEVRSPRTLPSWLELDAHRRPRLFAGWIWWLLGGLILGGVVLGGLYARQGDRAFQAGPLTRSHALFNHDCGKCHTSSFTTVTRLWRGDAVGSVDDSACLKCHTGAIHHTHAGPVGRCVSCHKEHRGHDALVHMPDSSCVRCHQNLRREDGTEPLVAGRVTAFDSNQHPPFRTPADEGTLRFNHAVHLSLKGDNALTCARCHVPEDDGRYMKPIRYEEHCRSCHPLGANLVLDWPDPAQIVRAEKFRTAFLGKLEHPRTGQNSGGVRASLRDALTRFILEPDNAALMAAQPQPPRPLPDRERNTTVSRAAFEWVNGQMTEVGRVIFDGPGGCKYCHTMKGQEPAPPSVRDRWWKGARFAHLAHRSMTCQECHPATTSARTADVLIPGQGTCLKCHKPDGAGVHCVECHVYHDEGLQRAGRTQRALDIDWLLKRGQ